MVALGLARDDGGRFSLTDAGSSLARSHPHTIASIVAKEWFFYSAWAGLPQTIRDGHARIRPWRDRLADDPGQSLEFLRALDDLAGLFGAELAELADPGDARTLLDVGGGAGSHAAALVAQRPALRGTVLDLPGVESLVSERHPGLEFVVGDLHAERLGRPPGEQWDSVLLANILHDWPPEDCRAIVAHCVEVLAPGGTLLVYEWLLDPSRASPAPVALFALMMMVENEGGAAYTEKEVAAWLEEAGLSGISRRGSGPIAVMRALKPAAS
jgi:SAM-dependent methyltransferase